MSRYEATLEGEVEAGEVFTGFNEVTVFMEILDKLGWSPKVTARGNGGYYLIEVLINSNIYKLHTYLKKLTFGGRDGRPYEKRAQFSASIDRRGFDVIQSEKEFSLILALYRREEYTDTIICAWNIDDWGHNPGRAFNCFVDVTSVAKALEKGFAQHSSSIGQISCCFRPSRFLYYLENRALLHSRIITLESHVDVGKISNESEDQLDFAGKGNRKPQLDIPYQLIHLDVENPRLAPYLIEVAKPSPVDILSIIYDNFDTEVIALSMAANGYFDEEPIIVVPSKIPEGFKFSDYDDLTSLADKLQQLVNDGEIEFTVVEGNRRISTINLLLDEKTRKQINVYPGYPTVVAPKIR